MRKTGLATIYENAKNNKDIVFIGSDLGPGTLDNFKAEMPDQFVMEGISESHVLGMAAGMAMEGHRVYVNTIASFLTRRSLEQLALDICFENLNVTIYGNGGGLVYGPLGHSHTAVDDFSLLSSLPNLTVLAPADANEMKSYIQESAHYNGPIYIRLGKGGDPVVTTKKAIKIGKAQYFKKEDSDTLLITTGIMLQRCLEIQESICCDVLHYGTIKPFDEQALLQNFKRYKNVFVIEEHLSMGGLGSTVKDSLFKSSYIPKVFKEFNLGEAYIDIYGRQEEIFEKIGLDPMSLTKKIRSLITP